MLNYDGYRAHLFRSILELFDRNNIIVYVLPAHSSGKTQPLGIVLFSVFRNRLQDAVNSCAAVGSGQVYDVFDLCSLIRHAYDKAFTVSIIQLSFHRSGIWPFDPKKPRSVPRPATAEPDANTVSVEELCSAFEEKQKAVRTAILGPDATITRSGFIDTSKRSVVTSSRDLELARDLKKFQDAAAEEARKRARQDRRALSAAEEARHYRNERVRGCAALSGKGVEEFSRNMRSMSERRAVARMRTITTHYR